MPYPIWSHAADCVTEMIQRAIILTPEQELSIRSYVSRVPVRCVVDLLMTLATNNLTMEEAIMSDARDLLSSFDGTTAHADHHMAIISRLRDILGQGAWFHEGSSCYEFSERYFQYTRDTEEHIGFDPQYLRSLYTMLTEFSDDESDNSDDDSDASTEITVVATPAAVEGANAVANYDDDDDDEDDDDDDETISINSDSTDATIPLENDLAAFLEEMVDPNPEGGLFST